MFKNIFNLGEIGEESIRKVLKERRHKKKDNNSIPKIK